MLRTAGFFALVLALAAAASRPVYAAIDDPPGGLIASSTTLPKVWALFEHGHEKEATRAATTIEDWRLTQDKMSGTYRVYRLGRDERDITVLGTLYSEGGIHGGMRWQQTRNGVTYMYAGVHEARDDVSDRAWTSDPDFRDVRLIGESLALNAYVVEIDPPGGRHEWLFIDKKTGYVTRRDYVEKQRRFTALYDDYRVFDGIPEPSRVRTSDSYGNEREISLLSRTLDLTPDPHDVDVPPSKRTLVEFPAGTTAVRLPARFANGLVVVRVFIGLRPYDFLLDSGAAGIVIDPSIVEDQHLETYGTHIGATLGTFSETTTIVPTIAVAGLRLHGVVTRVVPVPFHLDDHTRISGLIGFDFFLDAVVHVDFEHGIVEALAPSGFKPPPSAVGLPLALDDRTPVVRARAGITSGRMVLDTGANRSVFTTAFASRADVAYDPSAAVAHFRGMGGTGTAEAVHFKSFDLAALSISDPMVDVSSADLGAEDVDGTAGTDLLRAYDLYFDYRVGTLYVRRTTKT